MELRVEILLAGGELCSVFHKTTKRECIWQARPEIWGSHAPILFPSIGKLIGDSFRYGNKSYPHPKHGIVRGRVMQLVDVSTSLHQELCKTLQKQNNTTNDLHPISQVNAVWMSLVSDANSHKFYPFDFEFYVAFSLHKNNLSQHFLVKNTGTELMPFALGGHPGFALPISDSEFIETCYLEFEFNETLDRHVITPAGFFASDTDPFLLNEQIIRLNPTLFDDDALVFHQPKSNKITLRCDQNAHFVEFDYSGFPILAIWAKPNAPYVCLEPWFGHADFEDAPIDFVDKPGIIKLEPGKSFQTSFSMRFG